MGELDSRNTLRSPGAQCSEYQSGRYSHSVQGVYHFGAVEEALVRG